MPWASQPGVRKPLQKGCRRECYPRGVRIFPVLIVVLCVAGCRPERRPPGPAADIVADPAASSSLPAGRPVAAPSTNLPPPLSPEPAAADYFPPGTFPDSVQKFVSDWYCKHLVVMREPPLLVSTQTGEESYRFLWLRTWGNPIAVHVVHPTGAAGAELTVTRLSGHGGYAPGEINLYRRKTLTQSEWEDLQRALAHAHYDTMVRSDDMGMDGAQWVIENVRGGKYRLIERWSPKASGPHAAFRAACDQFLDLAGPGLVVGNVY